MKKSLFERITRLDEDEQLEIDAELNIRAFLDSSQVKGIISGPDTIMFAEYSGKIRIERGCYFGRKYQITKYQGDADSRVLQFSALVERFSECSNMDKSKCFAYIEDPQILILITEKQRSKEDET